MVYGVTGMLLVAAIVEAFWSSARWLPTQIKYGAAAACWIAVLGYIAGAFLIGGSSYVDWAIFVFPAWVLLVSVSIMWENLRSPRQGTAGTGPRA